MMASGAFMIAFTGLPHIWSIFTPYVMQQTWWDLSSVRMNFYLVMCFFVIGNIIGGRLQDRISPRIVTITGGVMFFAGIALCVTMPENILVFYVYYGVLQGLGSGAVYITIITTAQKWFPQRTGFASGIIIATNGLSGLFMAPLCRFLLGGYGIEATFAVLVVLILLALLSNIFCILVPPMLSAGQNDAHDPASWHKQYTQYTTREMLRSGTFYLLCGAMTLGLITYFIVSPLSQILLLERGVSESAAVMAVMAGSVANAGARLLVPSLGDSLGRAKCLAATLLISVFAAVLMIFGGGTASMLALVFLYMCYGGVLGSFPALTLQAFGLAHAGENYGYMLIGLALPTVLIPIIAPAIESSAIGLPGLIGIGVVASAASCLIMLWYSGKADKNMSCVKKKPAAEMQ